MAYEHVQDERVRAALIGRVDANAVALAYARCCEYLISDLADRSLGVPYEVLTERANHLILARVCIREGTTLSWRQARECLRRYFSV
jgi:hypothetical protein